MALRASWKGTLKLSLVAIPVRLYNTIDSGSKITLNQYHKGCNSRIKYAVKCPTHGEIQRSEIVKGYEISEGKFVEIDEKDLEKIALESNKTIDLVQFVDESEIAPVYYDSAFYLGPDGPVAQEAYNVIAEALRRSKKVGIGRVVMRSKEYIVALKPLEKGFSLFTLRYESEIRKADPYFEDLTNGEMSPDLLKLAQQLIDSLSSEFNPSAYQDRYQQALLDLIQSKRDGKELTVAPDVEAGKVVDLMEALKQSVTDTQPKAVKKPGRAPSVRTKRKAKAKKTA